MATYDSDVAAKGTVLRQRSQEDVAEITGQVTFPVGTVLSTGDLVNLFDLAPNTALTYLRIRMPGLNNGADNGFESTVGYASEGSLLAPDPDVDAFSAAADDGAGTYVEADLTGTNGTAFPGTGPNGGKEIWDNDIVHVRMFVDNAAPTVAVTADRPITFVARYKRINLDGGSYDTNDYEPSPIVLTADPETLLMDYNGQAANG